VGGMTGRAAWVDGLRGQTIALDTAPLIYYIEEHPIYLPLVDPFFDALDSGELRVVTSTMTLLEVLVQPLRRGDDALVRRYRHILLNHSGFEILAVSSRIAEEAARLRAMHKVSPPDALQLATAVVAGATAFVTNDIRLPRLAKPRMIVLDEL
jgi:predicted nucleic acid-binding protein